MIRKTFLILTAYFMALAPARSQVLSGDRETARTRPQALTSAVLDLTWSEDPQDRPAVRNAREEQRRARDVARAAARADRMREESSNRDGQYYERGKRALDQQQWDRAIERFDAVIQQGSGHTDGALYWKAYAQNKLGQQAAALATLEDLRKSHADSRWLNDAKALEVEVRQSTGQKVSPESVGAEDLKLMAINGLMNSDPEHALPMLEKFLQGNQPLRLKERALFVLTQSRSPQAREIVGRIAKGGSNPDLQLTAVKYLGLFGGQESRQALADVYASSTDLEVKRAVLHSFMLAGDRPRVLAAAQSERVPELRLDAIQQLGLMGGQTEMWQLYQQESSVDVKEKILHSMFLGGNTEKLVEVARTEKDPALRRAAIHSLALIGKKSGDALAPLYAGEQDKDIRKEIIGALFLQGNAHALVEIARKETDPELKKQAVSKLSLMHSKEGADYLMELLNK